MSAFDRLSAVISHDLTLILKHRRLVALFLGTMQLLLRVFLLIVSHTVRVRTAFNLEPPKSDIPDRTDWRLTMSCPRKGHGWAYHPLARAGSVSITSL